MNNLAAILPLVSKKELTKKLGISDKTLQRKLAILGMSGTNKLLTYKQCELIASSFGELTTSNNMV